MKVVWVLRFLKGKIGLRYKIIIFCFEEGVMDNDLVYKGIMVIRELEIFFYEKYAVNYNSHRSFIIIKHTFSSSFTIPQA
jgi:hypothetical protein